jgi:hypothetical protein
MFCGHICGCIPSFKNSSVVHVRRRLIDGREILTAKLPSAQTVNIHQSNPSLHTCALESELGHICTMLLDYESHRRSKEKRKRRSVISPVQRSTSKRVLEAMREKRLITGKRRSGRQRMRGDTMRDYHILLAEQDEAFDEDTRDAKRVRK